MNRTATLMTLVALSLAVPVQNARADGGTLRLSQQVGGYRLSVFTLPAPLRTGPIDVSMLIQDPATNRVLDDVRVTVLATPAGRPGPTIRQAAGNATAGNRLLQSATFDLPSPGKWHVEVRVDGDRGPAEVGFDVVAAEGLPPWFRMGIWIGLPGVAVALFGMHEALVEREARRRRRLREKLSGAARKS